MREVGRGEGGREGGGREGGRVEEGKGGGGGRGGVMPKRLKSGSGHHRLEICGPSNSRHKIAQCGPDFFAMFSSPQCH